MKKYKGLMLFFIVNISLVFIQLYKQSYVITWLFKKQRKERKKENLIVVKNSLEQELLKAQKREEVQEFAKKILGMQKVKRNQIYGL